MSRTGVWLVVMASLMASLVIIAGAYDNDIDYYNPVRTAELDEIKELPSLVFKPAFKQYSGYLEADDLEPRNKFFHYWYVESEMDAEHAPLVLWLNGGPGCSSMEGVLTESGPYRMHENGSVLKNEFGWTQHLNVLYIEGPAGVGFSYGARSHDYEVTDDGMGKQYLKALLCFFNKFPKLKMRPLYIVGESYGATYASVLSWRIVKEAKDDINLKGFALGNGYTEADLIVKALFFYAYQHAFLSDAQWASFSQYCCQGKPPTPEVCLNHTETDVNVCLRAVRYIAKKILLPRFNSYNVFDDCHDNFNNRTQRSPTRMDVERQLLLDSMDDDYCGFGTDVDRLNELPDDTCESSDCQLTTTTSKESHFDLDLGEDSTVGAGYGSKEIPCWDGKPMEDYLKRADVLKALHIPDLTPFVTCAPVGLVKYHKTYPCKPGKLVEIIKAIYHFGGNQEILIYNGDSDIMCPFLAGRWFAQRFEWARTKQYEPWYHDNQIGGFWEQWHPITFATVRGAGHMVPQDKPLRSQRLLEQWIEGAFEAKSSQPKVV